MMQLLWKTVAVPQKVKYGLPFNIAILLLVINPREIKRNVHINICAQIFIAALVIITKS